MDIKAGTFLKSTSVLDDSVFEKTLLFITEHNAKGSIGFIINKLFIRNLNELVEFKHSAAFPLYNAGPVAEEQLFFIHRRPDLIADGVHITGSIYLGGNFKQAVAHINGNTISEGEVKIFVGYCGWDYAQLEEEVEEGSWVMAEKSDVNVLFA